MKPFDETMFRSVFLEGNVVVCRVRSRNTFDILWEDRVPFNTHDEARAFARAYELGQPFDRACPPHPDGHTKAEAKRATLWDALVGVCEEVADEDILGPPYERSRRQQDVDWPEELTLPWGERW